MDTLLPTQSAFGPYPLMAAQNQSLTETITRERGRLGNFIRQRVPDAGDAEDILQDVFFELVEAYRLPEPIEQVGAWLFRVARNRIIDRFRKKRESPLPHAEDNADNADNDAEAAEQDYWLEQALPAAELGPEAAYARARLLDAVALALDELPERQREVFIAHELDGLSFKTLAAESGVNVNTLLGWKRLAVLHLRARLQPLHNELSW
jgi:RNA polymerase sigma factor (sigma-70 family)